MAKAKKSFGDQALKYLQSSMNLADISKEVADRAIKAESEKDSGTALQLAVLAGLMTVIHGELTMIRVMLNEVFGVAETSGDNG